MFDIVSTACFSRYFNPVTLPIPPESPLRAIVYGQTTGVGRLVELPQPVLGIIIAGLRYDPRIADAGEQWEATDVIMTNAPCRRFVAAAHVGEAWAMLYEHGGRGYHQHLVIVEDGSSTPTVSYWGTGYACKPRSISCSAGGIDQADLKAAVGAGWFGPNEVGSDGCR